MLESGPSHFRATIRFVFIFRNDAKVTKIRIKIEKNIGEVKTKTLNQQLWIENSKKERDENNDNKAKTK